MKHILNRVNKAPVINEFYEGYNNFLKATPDATPRQKAKFASYAITRLMRKTTDSPARFIQNLMSHAFWATRQEVKTRIPDRLKTLAMEDELDMAQFFQVEPQEEPQDKPQDKPQDPVDLLLELQSVLAVPYTIVEQAASDLPLLTFQQKAAYSWDNAQSLAEIMLDQLDTQNRAEQITKLVNMAETCD